MSTSILNKPEIAATPSTSPPHTIRRSPGLRERILGFGRTPRIMGLDVARGLAVLGMVGAHLGSVDHLLVWTDPSTWLALIHGRSAAVFAILAGISIALMTGRTVTPARAELPGLRLSLIGRAAAIFGIGILLELLGTNVSVILTFYGVLFIAAIPFLRWSAGRLMVAAAALALAGPPLRALLTLTITPTLAPGLDLVLFGVYPLSVYLAFVLLGIGLGRLKLTSVRITAAMLASGIGLAVLGYGVGGVVEHAIASATAVDPGVAELSGEMDISSLDIPAGIDPTSLDPLPEGAVDIASIQHEMFWQIFVADSLAVYPHSGGVFEIVGSGGFALAVISLCLLVAVPLRAILIPVAALGAMPITAYAAHIAVIALLNDETGFVQSNAVWVWTGAGLLVACTLWAIAAGRGPLEWLVARAATAMRG